PIKIYLCNIISYFQYSINLVQLDLQGYNPRNGQSLLKVRYKGPSNYSNSSTMGFEPQTSCMAVWQPNYYTKITRPSTIYYLNFYKYFFSYKTTVLYSSYFSYSL